MEYSEVISVLGNLRILLYPRILSIPLSKVPG